MSSALVLLVSRSASRTQVYREALDQQGVSCLAISAIKEVLTLTAGTQFNGILLDMPVLVKASPDDKAAIEDVLKALPSAYLNIAPATDSIKLMTVNGLQGMATSLEGFAALCKGFTARLVLPKNRFSLHLHALLRSADAVIPEERTVTLNVSYGGCFLFSATPDYEVNQQVTITFIGLNDDTPVSATICWLQRWGDEGHQAPGVGVRFDRITDGQLAKINSLLKTIKPDPE